MIFSFLSTKLFFYKIKRKKFNFSRQNYRKKAYDTAINAAASLFFGAGIVFFTGLG